MKQEEDIKQVTTISSNIQSIDLSKVSDEIQKMENTFRQTQQQQQFLQLQQDQFNLQIRKDLESIVSNNKQIHTLLTDLLISNQQLQLNFKNSGMSTSSPQISTLSSQPKPPISTYSLPVNPNSYELPTSTTSTQQTQSTTTTTSSNLSNMENVNFH